MNTPTVRTVDDGASPLESPALGASLSSLISPCGDRRRADDPPPSLGVPIGVALSGGGFRATFAGLGVIRFLADAGVLGDLRYVSSVSGGSVANGMVATRWAQLRDGDFSAAAVDEHVIAPLVKRVTGASLKKKLLRNVWRAIGSRNRTDVLAWAFDDWLFDGVELESLDAGCRWIFNAANLVTGARFGFERDVVGDYVVGLAPTQGSGIRVAQAVAASAAVPGAFAPMKIDQTTFPCAGRGVPLLLDGGAYDNSGLEALDSDRYRDVCTIALNAGGVFVTGALGKFPLVRDLTRANSLLYRQSTSLRTRWMVERFKAWREPPAGQAAPPDSRRGVLFGLASNIDDPVHNSPAFDAFVDAFPEHRTFRVDGVEKDLAFVPTVFDQLAPDLVHALIYRGWWLTGATLAQHHPEFAPLSATVTAPSLTG